MLVMCGLLGAVFKRMSITAVGQTANGRDCITAAGDRPARIALRRLTGHAACR
jgi:hypothetical protein